VAVDADIAKIEFWMARNRFLTNRFKASDVLEADTQLTDSTIAYIS
jgi:hypothetical protein